MIAAMKVALRSGALGSMLAVALLMAASGAALSQASRDSSDDSGMIVMSDTPEWCAHLQNKVTELAQVVARPHVTADMLARQGRKLCAHGHIRLGITRLRYALIQLRAQQQVEQSEQSGP